jgi:hypothetical protein
MSGFKQVGGGKDDKPRDFHVEERCHRCGSKASLTLFQVVDTRTGVTHVGTAGEFSSKNEAGNYDWQARDGYMVSGATGWCGDCYLAEAQAQRLERAAA